MTATIVPWLLSLALPAAPPDIAAIEASIAAEPPKEAWSVPIDVVARALPAGSAPGAVPVAITVHNRSPGTLEHTSFSLKPNGWNGETVHLALVDLHRDGVERELVIRRPRVAAPRDISGMARHQIAPGGALEIRTDLASWIVDGGWLPGAYEATIRVERLSIDSGRCLLSVASPRMRFEVPAGVGAVAPAGPPSSLPAAASPAGPATPPETPPETPPATPPATGSTEQPAMRPDLAGAIRTALRSDAPIERSQAMTTIRELQAIAFLPELVELVDDPAPLPRDGDTGWGFVGHQAASLLAEIAVAMRRLPLDERHDAAHSFHDDQWRGGEALDRDGRLAEVQATWQRWLEALRGEPHPKGRHPAAPTR